MWNDEIRHQSPCLHQHVGTWIEAEDELEWLLAHIDATVVALGPDTGHLTWAGIDPTAFIARHAERVQARHVKDIHLDVAARHRGGGASYRAVVLDGLWAERGVGTWARQRLSQWPAAGAWKLCPVDRQ